jgi:hypothetical protein
LFHLAIRERFRVVKNAADECGFSVVHVTDEYDSEATGLIDGSLHNESEADVNNGKGDIVYRKNRLLRIYPKGRNENDLHPSPDGGRIENEMPGLLAVVADRLNWAAFHRFLTKGSFRIVLGLLVEVAVTAVVVTLEVCRCGFAAEVAIDALVIDVEFAGYVFRIFVRLISHRNGRAS